MQTYFIIKIIFIWVKLFWNYISVVTKMISFEWTSSTKRLERGKSHVNDRSL